MRERVELLLGGRVRGMWVMTFHAACARLLRAEAARLGYTRHVHDLRPGRRTAADQALPRRGGGGHEALHAGRGPQPDLRREEQAARRRGLPPARRVVLRAARSPTSTTSTSARCTARTRWTSTTCSSARSTSSSCSRRSATTTRACSATCSSTSTRTPTTRSTGCCSSSRASTEPGRCRRRCAVDLRLPWSRHPQPPGLRGRLSRRDGRQARAELPLDADDPQRRERGHLQQPRAEAQVAVDGPRRRRPHPHPRDGRRARRGAVRRRRDRAAARHRARPRGDRRLLPDERAVAGPGGHAGPPRGRLPGHRRDEVLRPRRDQGRARLPHRPRQPAGRQRLHPDRQRPPPRHRRHVAVTGADPRGDARHPGLGRRGRPWRGAGARDRRAEGHRPVHADDGGAARARRPAGPRR